MSLRKILRAYLPIALVNFGLMVSTLLRTSFKGGVGKGES